MSMCFDNFPVTGLADMKIDPWLSPSIGIGCLNMMPSSPIRVCIQTTWRLQSESAIYSASVEESATVFCARDVQLMRPFASLTKYPVCDKRVVPSDAQSESQHAWSP